MLTWHFIIPKLPQKCLQEGESLLSRLHSVYSQAELDSRTEVFKHSLARSIEQVKPPIILDS